MLFDCINRQQTGAKMLSLLFKLGNGQFGVLNRHSHWHWSFTRKWISISPVATINRKPEGGNIGQQRNKDKLFFPSPAEGGDHLPRDCAAEQHQSDEPIAPSSSPPSSSSSSLSNNIMAILGPQNLVSNWLLIPPSENPSETDFKILLKVTNNGAKYFKICQNNIPGDFEFKFPKEARPLAAALNKLVPVISREQEKLDKKRGNNIRAKKILAKRTLVEYRNYTVSVILWRMEGQFIVEFYRRFSDKENNIHSENFFLLALFIPDILRTLDEWITIEERNGWKKFGADKDKYGILEYEHTFTLENNDDTLVLQIKKRTYFHYYILYQESKKVEVTLNFLPSEAFTFADRVDLMLKSPEIADQPQEDFIDETIHPDAAKGYKTRLVHLSIRRTENGELTFVFRNGGEIIMEIPANVAKEISKLLAESVLKNEAELIETIKILIQWERLKEIANS